MRNLHRKYMILESLSSYVYVYVYIEKSLEEICRKKYISQARTGIGRIK